MKIPATGYVMNKFEVLGIVGEGELQICEAWKLLEQMQTLAKMELNVECLSIWLTFKVPLFFLGSVKAIFTFFHKADLSLVIPDESEAILARTCIEIKEHLVMASLKFLSFTTLQWCRLASAGCYTCYSLCVGSVVFHGMKWHNRNWCFSLYVTISVYCSSHRPSLNSH